MKADQIDFCSLTIEKTCAHFRTNPQTGLNEDEVGSRLRECGKNELPRAKRFSIGFIFFRQFSSPLIWFLLVGAGIAGLLGEWIQMSAIGVIVLINAVISFFQEYSAEKSFEALKSLYVTTSRVIRSCQMREIPSADIVPGDLVLLEAGDLVPADGRLFYVAQLAIQEAALTGESNAVHKRIEPSAASTIADQKNMVFSGTHVVSGRGKFIATRTGLQTELGKIAASLQVHKIELTPLQVRFNRLGKQLIFICIAIVAVISCLGFWKGMGVVEIALTSLSLAVAAIPEGLPAIVTITLAMGVRRMAKKNALMRRLASVETLGCTSVICTDKTGTLTKNEMAVLHFWIGDKQFDVSGIGYEPKGDFQAHGAHIAPQQERDLLCALTIGVLCNNAELYQQEGLWKIAGDPTEGALLVAAAKAGLWKKDLEQASSFLGEIPFDSERKRMSVLRNDSQLYVKGALEAVLPLCHRCLWDGRQQNVDEERKGAIFAAQHRLASQGFRVLALAQRDVPGQTQIDPSLENKLQFVGLVAMMDPPRSGVKEAIDSCREAGIIPVMVTGDHKETAIAVARKIGLMMPHSIAVEGAELDHLDDSALNKMILQTAVFARVSALHKLRIIQAWKSHGHIVAMTGDGVNDAPAIKRADIGIAMGITGTEVTKQVSDMVILDDHFATIVTAVKEGRSIYSNIVKFVRFLLSANFAELLVIFFGILWEFAGASGEVWAILLPSQILWINLVTDGCPAIALVFDPVEKAAMKSKPRKISEPILSLSWILKLVFIGLIAALGTIFAAHLGFLKSMVIGQTMAFTELVILELGLLFLIRMPLSVFSNLWLLATVVFSVLLQLIVIYFPPMQIPFGTHFLEAVEWLKILGIASGVNFFVYWLIRSVDVYPGASTRP
ncbi:MAG: cation-translocating P-type ATPase [Chlamydiia bacterium]|nr:cation-translocating P-type ATPase [Chlamydiia bacterium]